MSIIQLLKVHTHPEGYEKLILIGTTVEYFLGVSKILLQILHLVVIYMLEPLILNVEEY